MSVTSAPIGSTGQSLDGFAVDADVLQAFRESVVITGPNVSTEIITPVSTQPTTAYGIPVWPLGTTQVFGATSTQIVSSIPFYVSQSSAPWTMIGSVGVSSVAAVVSTWPLNTTRVFGQVSSFAANIVSSYAVTSQPTVIVGTSQVFGAVSSQIVSSLPLWVSQSSAPWSIIGGVSVTSQSAVSSSWPISTTQVFGTVSTQIVSSLPLIVAQSTSPWVVSGSTQVVSSIPFFVAQSSAPWSIVETVSTAGGATATTVVCLAGLNSTVIKSSAGQLYGYALSNFGGSPVFVKVCNTTQVGPVSTQPLIFMMGCGVSTSVVESLDMGVPFSQGITIYTVINPFAAGAGSTGVLSSSVTLTLLFK